jgi:acyl-[acyl-carrier-protein]-phospholipid O-acyltransferase / long-chain-fatty-acid--[acyl-carrier-protein] ligase
LAAHHQTLELKGVELAQLHQRFIDIARHYGGKTAIIDKATSAEYKYSKLLIASLILTGFLRKYNSKYIGIMLPTTAGCALSIIGTLMAGKIPVMINYSTGAIENCLYAREKCRFKTIITSLKLIDKLNLRPIDHMVMIEDILKQVNILHKLKAALISKLPLPILKRMVSNGPDTATSVILFTSGSEKEPKAVQLSHKNIAHNVDNVQLLVKLTAEDVFLSELPFFHVFGLTVDLWIPLLIGCSLVTYPNPLDYKEICGLVKQYNITIMAATPTFFYGYLQRSDPGDFSSVRFAFAGADKLPEKVYEGYIKRHNIQLFEAYGTTETSPAISANTPTHFKLGSIGKPLPNVQVKIVDIETGKKLSANQEGKILVKGDNVMTGYLDDYEETLLRIREGWYDTGDIGIIDDDGYLWHRGRLKRFVKVGGEMVSLPKVEDILSHLLPEDVICCVVDVPNMAKGADVVAAVANGNFDRHKVLRELKKQLPSIAIPKEFYVIENIPMMGSGKVNFREVEKICRDMAQGKKKDA